MRICRVVGPMWATVKHPMYAGHTLFVVQPLDQHGADTGASFVAMDHAQAGPGDQVIVLTEGGGVRQILQQGDQVPVRSLIVGIVDTTEIQADTDAGASNA
jgi:ethanolamine utilization protein EutN